MMDNKSYPKISIVTPNYNGGATLEETIFSVISQGYPNLEYIIVDGGSTDNSLEIIEKYRSHFAYVISEKDNGLYDALNKGFALCTGEIMAYLNSDDLYVGKPFFKVAELFGKHPQIKWLSGFNLAGMDNLTKMTVGNQKIVCRHDYLIGQFEMISQDSVFWKRDLFNLAGSKIPTTFNLAGDVALWALFFNHSELYYTNYIFSIFRWTGNNLSSDFDKYHQQAYKATKLTTLKPSDSVTIFFYRLLVKSLFVFSTKFRVKLHYLIRWHLFKKGKFFVG